MSALTGIALAYAPRRCRDALYALWNYDAALARVVASTTEPLIGQMRMTWWHDRMIGLDAGEVPAERVIAALNDMIRHHDVTGALLAGLVEGWELLLDAPPLGDDVLCDHAAKRGDRLFDLSARVLGKPVAPGLGANWALIDFAMRTPDRATSERAWALVEKRQITGPKPLRILAKIAEITTARRFDQLHQPVSRWTLLRAVLS